MFIGHWAPALAAAAAIPRSPRLGTLFVAAQLTDFAFFAFAILGLENMRITPGMTVMNDLDLYHMPYTHSLAGTAFWALGFSILIFAMNKDRFAALIGGMVVLSHWFIDFLVHTQDLTLWGVPPKLGLGLWNYPLLVIPLELGITGLALYWYWRKTRGPAGPIAILAILLMVIQLVDWFGTPPAQAGWPLYAMAISAFTITCLAATWVGRTRRHIQPQG